MGGCTEFSIICLPPLAGACIALSTPAATFLGFDLQQPRFGKSNYNRGHVEFLYYLCSPLRVRR